LIALIVRVQVPPSPFFFRKKVLNINIKNIKTKRKLKGKTSKKHLIELIPVKKNKTPWW